MQTQKNSIKMIMTTESFFNEITDSCKNQHFVTRSIKSLKTLQPMITADYHVEANYLTAFNFTELAAMSMLFSPIFCN